MHIKLSKLLARTGLAAFLVWHFIFLPFHPTVYADDAANRALVENLVNTSSKFSVKTHLILAESVKNMLGRDTDENPYYQLISEFEGTRSELQRVTDSFEDPLIKSFYNLGLKYQTVRTLQAVPHGMMRGLKTAGNIALTVGPYLLGGPAGGALESLAIHVFAGAAQRSMNHSMQMFETTGEKLASDMVQGHFDRLEDDLIRAWNELKSSNPTEAHLRASNLYKDLETALLINIETEADKEGIKAVFDAFILRATVKAMTAQGDIQRSINRDLQDQIQTNAENLVRMSDAVLSEVSKNTDQINLLKDKMQLLTSGLNTLYGKVDVNTQRIDNLESNLGFLQEMMFGRMSPQEQLKFLEFKLTQATAHNDTQKVNELTPMVNTLKLSIDVRTIATHIFAGADLALAIGSAAGMDPDTLNTASTVLAYGKGAYNLVDTLLANPTFAGIASALTQLLGIGGPNIAAIRHQQIMEGLGKLLKGQQIIIENQQRMFEGLINITENQKRIFDQVLAVGKAVQESHQIVMSKLHEMHQDILQTQGAVYAIMNQSISKCTIFIDPHRRARSRNPDYDAARNIFLTYSGIHRHFVNTNGSFFECVSGLEQAFGTIDDVSKHILLLKNYQSSADVNVHNTYLEEMYYPLWRYYQSAIGEQNGEALSNLRNSYLNLGIPSKRTSNISQKSALTQNTALEESEYPYANLLGEPVSLRYLIKYTTFLLHVYPYMELTTNNGLLSLNQVFDNDSYPYLSDNGLQLLYGALSMINLAIAQEALRGGDMMLPYMYEVLNTPLPTEQGSARQAAEEKQEETIHILKTHALIAKNYVIYALNRALKETNKTLATYHVAAGRSYADTFESSSTTKTLLNHVFDTQNWVFHWHPNSSDQLRHEDTAEISEPSAQESQDTPPIDIPTGWSLKISDDLYIALPDAPTLFNDTMNYQYELGELLKLKGQVIDAILDFKYQEELTPQERTLFTFSILKGI